jgi:hypothetical protein
VGVLPFRYRAELRNQAGDVIEPALRCTIWPESGVTAGRGSRHYSHSGEAAVAHAEQLRQPNMTLVLAPGGPMAGSYKIVRATQQPDIPHVELSLNRSGN